MKARGIWLAGNWKLNHGPRATRTFFQELAQNWDHRTHSQLRQTFFTPALSLEAATHAVSSTALATSTQVGAQNIYWEPSGAFTGEISAPLAQEAGASCVLIGHSERRILFGETLSDTARKVQAAQTAKIPAMLCVGETREERQAGKTRQIIQDQLDAAAATPDSVTAIAYEPVWAIGTGLSASPEQAQEVHTWIREWLWARWGMDRGQVLPVLYGGSANAQNAAALLALSQVDGLLVGGASLKVSSWLPLVDAAITCLGPTSVHRQ